jgi:hypothetical protein
MMEQKKKWIELEEILTKHLSILDGDDVEKVRMRKYLLHCDHNASFHDFLFLLFGPLEFGVYYRPQADCPEISSKNKSRFYARQESIKALKVIGSFPEFPEWHFHVEKIGVPFAKAVLGQDLDKKSYKPGGYLKALYRTRMLYREWVRAKRSNTLSKPHQFSPDNCAVWDKVKLEDWISLLSEGFLARANAKCEALKHLDHFQSANSTTTDLEQDQLHEAHVEKIDLDDKAKVFVVRNAMSKTFLTDIKQEAGTFPFMAYADEDEGGDKDGRRIRIASKDYTTFLVSKGPKTKVFGSAEMKDIEVKLLDVMRSFLCIYAELFEKVLDIKVRLPDQLQEVKDTVRRGGYDYHNDQSGLCCLLTSEKKTEANKSDWAEHMLVATYVVSNITQPNTAVRWKHNETVRGSIETGDNDLHFQAVHCQTSYVHRVESKVLKRQDESPDKYRLVFSARATMHFQRDEPQRLHRTRIHCFGAGHGKEDKQVSETRNKYRFINVLGNEMMLDEDRTSNQKSNDPRRKKAAEQDNQKKKRKVVAVKKPCDPPVAEGARKKRKEGIENQPKKQRVVSVSLLPDTFGNAPHHQHDPVRPTNPVIIDEPFYRLGMSETVYKHHIKQRLFYEVVGGKQNDALVHFGPYIVKGEEAKVGDLIPTNQVEAFLRISAGGKEGSLCWNPDNPNGVLMRHAYKNDVRGIQSILDSCEEKPLWIGLTGGNPEIRGQTVVTASKVTTNCESGYFPKLQKFSKQNISLLQLALANGTITLFLENPRDAATTYYLGCYYLDGFHTAKESLESLRKTGIECSKFIGDKDGMFTRFQERTHVRVRAVPYQKRTVCNDPWKKVVLHEKDVFPIGIEGAGKGEPNEILSLNHEKRVSYDTVLQGLLQKPFWNDIVENESDAMDDVTDGSAAVKMKGLSAGSEIKIKVEEFLSLMVCVSVAVFCRLLRMNVSNKVVTPLRNSTKWFQRLGNVLQTFSFPHPGRVYDVTPLTLISFSDSQGNGRSARCGVKWMAENEQETKELLFAAIVATTTGRMSAMHQWSDFKKVTDGDLEQARKDKTVFFPRPSEVQDFLEYMRLTSRNGKIGSFLSDQFRKSLPTCIESVDAYSYFLEQVQEDLKNLYDAMVAELWKSGKKQKLISIMKAFIENKTTGDRDTSFVASQIIYNIDEMIDLAPSTDWEEIEFGFGSKQAMHWLMGGDKEEYMMFIESVKEAVKQLDDNVLACLGLERVMSNRIMHVRWKINQRDFGAQDTEHFACKVWLVMVRIIGARPGKNPRLHKPHLHPLRVEGCSDENLYCCSVHSIAEEARAKFRDGDMQVPPFFNKWSG